MKDLPALPDLSALPFDTDTMIEGLRPWVLCESPSYDVAALGAMARLIARQAAELGAQVELIPGATAAEAPSVRARMPHPRAGTPGIMITGHFDTVHPVGALALNPFRREGTRLYGPGILDMKGGDFIALDAMRAVLAEGHETPLPVTFLFTPDEEIGTPHTRALIEAEARRNRYVLCPEPEVPGGGVTTGRFAIARYEITARGVPSHAGATLAEGTSAVRELARRILEIEAMSTEACTFSVNDIGSGQWVNCVPDFARAQVLSMAKRQGDLDHGRAAMAALGGPRNGVDFRVRETVTRPVWEDDRPETLALYTVAQALARADGHELPRQSSPGGSDANFTGALGIASLCSLGVAGSGYHTPGEYLDISSLARRARLLAGLYLTLGA